MIAHVILLSSSNRKYEKYAIVWVRWWNNGMRCVFFCVLMSKFLCFLGGFQHQYVSVGEWQKSANVAVSVWNSLYSDASIWNGAIKSFLCSWIDVCIPYKSNSIHFPEHSPFRTGQILPECIMFVHRRMGCEHFSIWWHSFAMQYFVTTRVFIHLREV